MALAALIPVLGGIVGKVIDNLFPDKEKAAEAKLQAMALIQTEGLKELDAASQIIVAEAKSESWLARNWRPITMMVFVSVIANNYILLPYAGVLGLPIVPLELPGDVWGIIQLGLGGYVIGRSAEKAIRFWKSKEGS